MNRHIPFLSALVCLTLLPVLVVSAPARAAEPMKQLSLSDVLKTALERNLDLVSARKDPEISQKSVEIQDSVYDSVLNTGISHSESEQEVFNISDVTSQTFSGANATFSQNLKSGADYSAEFRTGRSETSGALITLDTSYSSTVDLILNVPLLRGAGKRNTTEQLELARGNLEISKDQLEIEAQRVMEIVEGAYWDVRAAIEALRIENLALERAEDLLDLNRKKVDVGTLAPIEITQAEAGVASQEENVILAETNLFNAEDELRRLMAVPEHDPMWGMRLDPTDQPVFESREIDLDAAIDTAMRERAEIRTANQTIQNRELSARVARNGLRPALDARLQLTPSGNNFSSDAGPDGIVGTFDDTAAAMGAFSESVSEIPDFASYNWSASVNLSYPIGNKRAKADYAIASLNKEKAMVDLKNQEQSIRVEVRREARGVESGSKRVDAARESVRLEKEKLNAEQKKYDNGMTTSFEVLEFQQDLAAAELAQIRAVLDYNKALAAFERSKGTLLESRGLSLAD